MPAYFLSRVDISISKSETHVKLWYINGKARNRTLISLSPGKYLELIYKVCYITFPPPCHFVNSSKQCLFKLYDSTKENHFQKKPHQFNINFQRHRCTNITVQEILEQNHLNSLGFNSYVVPLVCDIFLFQYYQRIHRNWFDVNDSLGVQKKALKIFFWREQILFSLYKSPNFITSYINKQ